MTIGSHRILNTNILAISLFLFLFVPITHAGPSGRTIETQLSAISFTPTVLNTSVSQSFTLNLSISDVTDLYLWVTTIQWNASVLNLTNYSEGSFLKQGGLTTFIVGKTGPGKIEGLTCSLIGSLSGVNGNGTFATFQFKALAFGTTSIDITFSDLLDSKGVSMPHNTVSSTIDVIRGHDVSITNISLQKTVVGQDYCLNMTVIAADLGDYQETFNVTVYANTTSVASQNVTLPSGNFTTMTFTWDTTGFAFGNYTLTAYAWPLPLETNSTNNNCTDGSVTVAGIGDLTGDTGNALDFVPDGTVNMKDVGVVARFFLQEMPPAPSNCDVTGPTVGMPDGTINMSDVGTVARQFGQHY